MVRNRASTIPYSYLYWTDDIGLSRRNHDLFTFSEVQLEVDTCIAGANQCSARFAALHGLWYVTTMEGAVNAASNSLPSREYAHMAK